MVYNTVIPKNRKWKLETEYFPIDWIFPRARPSKYRREAELSMLALLKRVNVKFDSFRYHLTESRNSTKSCPFIFRLQKKEEFLGFHFKLYEFDRYLLSNHKNNYAFYHLNPYQFQFQSSSKQLNLSELS